MQWEPQPMPSTLMTVRNLNHAAKAAVPPTQLAPANHSLCRYFAGSAVVRASIVR